MCLLYRYLSKLDRTNMAAALEAPIVTKKKLADGTLRVSAPQGRCLFPLRPRYGGPGLKGTQVYPEAFGRRVLELHKRLMDRGKFVTSSCGQENGGLMLRAKIKLGFKRVRDNKAKLAGALIEET